MESLGHFVAIEDRVIPIKHSDRSKTPIEPYLSDQWFVKMEDLAQAAMDAVVGWPGEILPLPLRQDLPGLARRKTRLVHQPPTLVGPSDSGVDIGIEIERSEGSIIGH